MELGFDVLFAILVVLSHPLAIANFINPPTGKLYKGINQTKGTLSTKTSTRKRLTNAFEAEGMHKNAM